MRVPFVDLKAQYLALKPRIDDAIRTVIEETSFIRGRHVDAFERAFAEKSGVRHCVTCANGTDAIYIALRTLGIGPGDEVVTVANSWISTSETITQAGARAVFVDIDDYFHIDPERIEEKITPRTKAVLPVHLYGQPADIEPIREICERRGLAMIEDCAQSHFAVYRGRRTGTFGLAGTFSFYPGKNLGAYGDAGALITDDDDFARRARMFANHGALKKHHHETEGINSRMDGIQGAVLGIKLAHIDAWNAARAENARLYTELLKGVPEVGLPRLRPETEHIFHLYVIRVHGRDALAAHLAAHGVETGIHYPTALPFLPAYGYLGHRPADFPRAFAAQGEILSLPMFPELTEAQIRHVVSGIREFFEARRPAREPQRWDFPPLASPNARADAVKPS